MTVEKSGEGARIVIPNPAMMMVTRDELVVVLVTVDEAEALRDALSAFIAFHKR